MADFSIVAAYKDQLAIIGCVAVSYLALRLFFAIWNGIKTFLIPGVFGANPKKMGQWAVITGATDGIGKAYAVELAKKGMDIVLISRTPEKLDDVAAEIESKNKVKTKCVPADFSKGPEIYDNIKKELEGLDIGVLVNNVGMSYNYTTYYDELSEQEVQNMVNLNVTSVARMTHIVLQGMVARKRGMIINIGSASGLFPTPFLGLYSGTKSFVDFFTRSLQVEYKDSGIVFQSVMPAFVTSKLSKIRRSNFMIPNPTTFVKYALPAAGVKTQTTGFPFHGLQFGLLQLLPDTIVMPIITRKHLTLRKIAIKKNLDKKK